MKYCPILIQTYTLIYTGRMSEKDLEKKGNTFIKVFKLESSGY